MRNLYVLVVGERVEEFKSGVGINSAGSQAMFGCNAHAKLPPMIARPELVDV